MNERSENIHCDSIYEELFDQHPGIILLYDRSGKLHRSNRIFQKKIEIHKKKQFNTLMLYDYPILSSDLQELIRDQKFVDIEMSIPPEKLHSLGLRVKDSSQHVELHIKAIQQGKDSKTVMYMVNLNLFSMSDKILDLLDENAAQLQAMVENSPMGMYFYQLDKKDDLIFVNYNKAADRILGIKNAQFLGKTIEQAFPPLADTEVPMRYKLAAKKGEVWYTEQISYEDDKLQGAFEVWAFQTSPGKMVALFLDITERKQSELALIQSETKFRMMVETTHDWVWEVDKDAVFTYVSPQVERILGYTPEELIGTSALDLMAEDEAQKIGQEYSKIVEDGRAMTSMINVNLHKNGSKVVLESTGLPFYDQQGELLGYRGIDRDITERQQLFENIQRVQNLESIGVLAGGIAHDFNNLLSGIFGFIELSVGISKDDKVVSYLNQALESMERAKSLTHQLLTFSKGGDPRLKVTSLKEFLPKSVDFVLSGKATGVEYQISEDLWDCEVDISQIGQVIDNLVINACQAMKDKGMVYVSASNVFLSESQIMPLKAGRYIRINIRDNGPGIKARYKNKIFDPFFTTKESGNGLGLTSSYSIIKRHKGSLELDSVNGEGSSFSIYLPATDKVESSVIRNTDVKDVFQGRILVMDDEKSLRDLMTHMLNILGFEVDVCEDGQQVLDILEHQKYDALIVDLTVPGAKGGLDIIQEVKLKVPLVLVASGYSKDPVMSDPEKYGFSGSLSKPFSLTDLKKVLAQYF